MKILLLVNDITRIGGVERMVANLSSAFVEARHKTSILSMHATNTNIFYTFDKRVKIIKCKSLFMPPFKTSKLQKEIIRIILFPINFFRKLNGAKANLKRELKNFNPDIVICNCHGNYLNPIIAKKSKYKTIKIVHSDFETNEKSNTNLEPFGYIVLLTSKNVCDFKTKYPQSIFSIIPNFLPSIPKESSPLQSKIVLSVGRMDKGDQKGFFRLVDVWEIVQKDLRFGEWKLHIVGDGLLKEQIQEKIKTKNLQDSIILKPFTNTIEQEYLQASIYVMTSHFEGLPMVLVESASFGLPQISFDINTGPSDIIENEKSGFLIPDGDLEGYAEKLKTLMQNQNLRESMGKRAKEIAQEKFSKEVVMKQWELLFEKIKINNQNKS